MENNLSNIFQGDNKKYFEKETFDKDTVSCILSGLLYKDKLSLLDNFNVKTIVYNKDDTVYGIFLVNTILFIVFRGTSGIKDILSDAKFIQADDAYSIPGEMHKGFVDKILTNKLCDKIEQQIVLKNTQIVVSGHSMGGAVASIFYAYLKVRNYTNLFLTTFGCPKVGNSEFSKYISDNLNVCRYVNGKDLVTFLPPTICYKHPKKSIIRTGKYSFFPNVNDHKLVYYYKYLTSLKQTDNK